MFREPEKFATWSPEVTDAVMALPRPAAGRVVLIATRQVYGWVNAMVIGPFGAPEDARGWWDAEFNKLAATCRMTILPAEYSSLPDESGAEPSP